MKTATLTAVVATLVSARVAVAAPAAATEGSGLLALLFLAFGALVVVTQLVPALTLFASMIATFFAGGRTEAAVAAGHRTTEAR